MSPSQHHKWEVGTIRKVSSCPEYGPPDVCAECNRLRTSLTCCEITRDVRMFLEPMRCYECWSLEAAVYWGCIVFS